MYNGDNEMRSFQTNSEGVKNLSTVCSITGARLIHLSSDYVFSEEAMPESGLFYEHHHISPLNRVHKMSFYSESKLAAEEYLQKNSYNHQILRTSWVYGTNSKGEAKGFVQEVVSTLLSGNKVNINKEWISIPTSVYNLVHYIAAMISWYRNGLEGNFLKLDIPFKETPPLRHIAHYTDDIRPYSRYYWASTIAKYMDRYIEQNYSNNEQLRLFESYSSLVFPPSSIVEYNYTPLGISYKLYDLPNLINRPKSFDEWDNYALNDIINSEVNKILMRN